MEDWKKVQLAHQLLGVLSKQTGETVTMFTSVYRNIFAVSLVPPVKKFGDDLLLINRAQAIAYLKQRYNFVTREERHKLLEETAKDINAD